MKVETTYGIVTITLNSEDDFGGVLPPSTEDIFSATCEGSYAREEGTSPRLAVRNLLVRLAQVEAAKISDEIDGIL